MDISELTAYAEEKYHISAEFRRNVLFKRKASFHFDENLMKRRRDPSGPGAVFPVMCQVLPQPLLFPRDSAILFQ